MKNERNPVDSIIILFKKNKMMYMQKMFCLKKGMKLCIQKDSLFISVGEFYRGISRAKALAGRSQRPSIR